MAASQIGRLNGMQRLLLVLCVLVLAGTGGFAYLRSKTAHLLRLDAIGGFRMVALPGADNAGIPAHPGRRTALAINACRLPPCRETVAGPRLRDL